MNTTADEMAVLLGMEPRAYAERFLMDACFHAAVYSLDEALGRITTLTQQRDACRMRREEMDLMNGRLHADLKRQEAALRWVRAMLGPQGFWRGNLARRMAVEVDGALGQETVLWSPGPRGKRA